MQSNRPRDTGPESRIRQELHREGLRFFKHRRPIATLRCYADALFPTWRLAVFVDGCFWHGCPTHATRPATNATWWATKLDRNIQRDRSNDDALIAAGWTVLRIWEHEPPSDAAHKVIEALVRAGYMRALATTKAPRSGQALAGTGCL